MKRRECYLEEGIRDIFSRNYIQRGMRMKNLFGLLKNFQEIQRVVGQLQDDLRKETVQVEAGGGLVKVVVNGNQEIVKIEISSDIINMKDKSLLEDLVLSVVNDARKKAQKIAQDKVKEVTGGLDIGLNLT